MASPSSALPARAEVALWH